MDARFPTHYMTDRRVVRATPEQFRLFVLATAWAVTNMTDGLIEDADLPLIPFADISLAEGLVDAGLWTRTEMGWIITDFQKTQTSAAQIEAALVNRRKADADRQKKKYDRDKVKGNPSPDPTDNQPSREPHVRNEGKERQGKERQGKERLLSTKEATSSEVSSKPPMKLTPISAWVTSPSDPAPAGFILTPELEDAYEGFEDHLLSHEVAS